MLAGSVAVLAECASRLPAAVSGVVVTSQHTRARSQRSNVVRQRSDVVRQRSDVVRQHSDVRRQHTSRHR
jgi:hypothetical protein